MRWSWSSFFDFIVNPYLIQGAWTTVWLTIAATAIGLSVGSIAAIMKMSRFVVLRYTAGFYVWLWRATPLLVQLVVLYTGLPQLGIRLTVLESALIGFGLNEGAYLAEVIRGGFSGVDPGQIEASRSLGMNPLQMMRVVVIPQVFRIILPPLGNQFNGMLKTSSLASVITLQELLRHAQQLAQVEFRVLEAYMAAAVYYATLTSLWGIVQRRLERRFDRPYGHLR